MPEQFYDQYGRPVILGEGAIDYLSMTTYNIEQLDLLKDIVNEEYGKSNTTEGVNHYIGWKWADYVFLGVKGTNEKAHGMVIFTAIHSDVMYRHMVSDKRIKLKEWKCTRIDIQITLRPRKNAMKLRTIGQMLEDGKFGKISNRREIEVKNLSSPSGASVYIGKPSSEKQRRIYDKYLTSEHDEVEHFQRYEIQYRKRTAESVFAKISVGGIEQTSNMIQRVIKGDVTILPEGFIAKLPISKWQPDMTGIATNRARKESKVTNTTAWIRQNRYAFLRACSQEGENGKICRETLFEAIVISITENPLEAYVFWKLLSGQGEIVDVAGKWYSPEQ